MSLTGYKLMHYGMLALARAERQGIRIDVDKVEKNKRILTRKINKHVEEFYSTDFYKDWVASRKGKEVNIDSPTQLETYVYDHLGLKVSKKTKSGKGATDEAALEALNIPELSLVLKARKLKKIRDTYLDSILRETVDGVIHPFFNLHTVLTYRSSSDSPNFQNFPIREPEAKKAIRGCFYPRKGNRLLEVDYGSLEVRIGACYHKDPTMIKYIKDPSSNMHTDMAEQIYFLKKYDPDAFPGHSVLRNSAKNSFVFPQFYGDYYGNNAKGLAKWLHLAPGGRWKDDSGIELSEGFHIGKQLRDNKITSYDKFLDHLQGIEKHFWGERFSVYNKWRDSWFRKYQRNGYFETLTGFTCSALMDRNSAINYPVQGSAFHCLLWSFIELDRLMQKEKWETKLIGQIHDSILFDVHPSEFDMVLEQVRRVTCQDLPNAWKWIIVPLEVEADACDIDQAWLHKDKIKI